MRPLRKEDKDNTQICEAVDTFFFFFLLLEIGFFCAAQATENSLVDQAGLRDLSASASSAGI